MPEYRNRTVEQILTEHIYHDTEGLSYRAASWIDHVIRTGDFAAFHYACIDARLAIEHLLFQIIIITKGATLTEAEYTKCLSSPTRLEVVLRRLEPDYEKLWEFLEIIFDLTPGLPMITRWNIAELKRSWGILSSYLHWSGASSMTTEDTAWQHVAIARVSPIIIGLWEKLSSSRTGALAPQDMESRVWEIWEAFRTGDIDSEQVRIRLTLIQPVLAVARRSL